MATRPPPPATPTPTVGGASSVALRSSSLSSRRKPCLLLVVVVTALVPIFLSFNQNQLRFQLPSNASIRRKGDGANKSSTKYNFLDELATLNNNASLATSNMTSSSDSNASLRTRDMIGQWIGNTWIPPRPWRYYSPAELRELYQAKTVLWLGDSLARRSFATFYSILNSSTYTNHTSVVSMTKPAIIDFNKHNPQVEFCPKWQHLPRFRPDACRPMPIGSGGSGGGGNDQNATIVTTAAATRGEFIKMKTVCFSHVEWFLQEELDGHSNLTANVDLVVLVLGIWDVVHIPDCRDSNNPLNAYERLEHLLTVAARFTVQTGKRIVWRTSGFDTVTQDNHVVYALNEQIMKTIDRYHGVTGGAAGSVVTGHDGGEQQKAQENEAPIEAPKLTYINWGGAVEARSFGPERIFGDHPSHYGAEARVVLIQMLTNHLHDLGVFSS